jgi:hypothetical protein
MANIKITKEQAKMLKEMGKPKVMKVTQEQYDKILETELSETQIPKSMVSALKDATKDDRTKLPAIKREIGKAYESVTEMYETFINELYGMNEDTQKVYEKLTKLMEVSGMIRDGRIVKEKFGGDKEKVREVISAGLHEMACGGSAYKAVEMMEEALKADDVKSTLIKQVRQKSTGTDTSSIADKRAAELKDRIKRGEIEKIPDDSGIKKLYPTEEDIERQDALEALAQGEQEQRLEEEGDTSNQVVGLDILNHDPFKGLPEDRIGADFKNHPSIFISVDDKLTVYDRKVVNSEIDGNIYAKSDLVGSEYTHPRSKVTFKNPGFINMFKKVYGEEPVFEILPGKGAILKNEKAIADKLKSDDLNVKAGKEFYDATPKGYNTDEATLSAAVNASAPIGKAAGPIYRTNVVEDELDVEIDTETQEVLKSVVDLLDSEFAHNITPDELIAKKETIDKLLSLLDNFETLPHGFNELKDEVTKLYLYADNPESFENYIGQLKIVNDYIKALGRNLFSEGELDEATTTDSMSYHDKQFSKDKFYYPKDAEGPKMKNGKLVREERNEQTRYVAEMDFYLWANDDEGAKVEAQRMASEMDSKYDNQPRIQKLFRQPFATMGSQEVPLNENEKTNTQWKGGSFVKIKDKCKKFPYCDAGADAIETKKTKDAVISNDHIIQEISNKTGKSIDEVTTILENFGNRQALQCLEVCKHTNSIIEANPNTIVEFEDEGSRFLAIFEPLEINEEELYIIQRFKYSQDGQNWRDERRSRKLTDPLWNNLFGYDVQTSDCKLIQAGIDNAKDGMATDLETLRPINKEIS